MHDDDGPRREEEDIKVVREPEKAVPSFELSALREYFRSVVKAENDNYQLGMPAEGTNVDQLIAEESQERDLELGYILKNCRELNIKVNRAFLKKCLQSKKDKLETLKMLATIIDTLLTDLSGPRKYPNVVDLHPNRSDFNTAVRKKLEDFKLWLSFMISERDTF